MENVKSIDCSLKLNIKYLKWKETSLRAFSDNKKNAQIQMRTLLWFALTHIVQIMARKNTTNKFILSHIFAFVKCFVCNVLKIYLLHKKILWTSYKMSIEKRKIMCYTIVTRKEGKLQWEIKKPNLKTSSGKRFWWRFKLCRNIPPNRLCGYCKKSEQI